MSEHSSVPLCVDCGQRPSLSIWNRRCAPCVKSCRLRDNQARWDLRRHWPGFDAPGMSRRILGVLAWTAAKENMDAVPWVERLTDGEFLCLLNMGRKSLARFREIVAAPAAEPDGALAAATARADGYALLVAELRAALESISNDLQDDPTGHRVGAALDAILAADPEARAAELLQELHKNPTSIVE